MTNQQELSVELIITVSDNNTLLTHLKLNGFQLKTISYSLSIQISQQSNFILVNISLNQTKAYVLGVKDL